MVDSRNEQADALKLTALRSADKEYFQICVNEFLADLKDYKNSVSVISVQSQKIWMRKLFRFLGLFIPLPALPRLSNDGVNVSVTIGPDFSPILQRSMYGEANLMYMFDCWEQNIHWVADFARIFRIKAIFFSAKQAADMFNKQKNRGNCEGHWLPEGIRVQDYNFLPIAEKDIDVLEFGRRYDAYHQQIKEPLANAGIQHLYASGKELLFPTEGDFINGLARSKISICFPSSLTHPERAGDISTMTLRYLQSMATKCLIVGKLPYDMQFLFDYNPVIEIDEHNPAGQLLEILHNFDRYQHLVERNYEEVVKHHRWLNRIESLMKVAKI